MLFTIRSVANWPAARSPPPAAASRWHVIMYVICALKHVTDILLQHRSAELARAMQHCEMLQTTNKRCDFTPDSFFLSPSDA